MNRTAPPWLWGKSDRLTCGGSLAGIDLSGVDLSGIDFSGEDLSGATLDRANLTDAVFDGADMRGATLNSAVLENAQLKAAKHLTLDQIFQASTWDHIEDRPAGRVSLAHGTTYPEEITAVLWRRGLLPDVYYCDSFCNLCFEDEHDQGHPFTGSESIPEYKAQLCICQQCFPGRTAR